MHWGYNSKHHDLFFFWKLYIPAWMSYLIGKIVFLDSKKSYCFNSKSEPIASREILTYLGQHFTWGASKIKPKYLSSGNSHASHNRVQIALRAS